MLRTSAPRRHSLPPAGVICLALALPAAAAAAPPLAAVHAAPNPTAALALADRLAADPAAARQGVDYLRGHLLEAMGKPDAAERAFSTAMRRAPELAPYCRYRLARLQLRHHPEVAAGLLAPLLARESPPSLRHHAAVLLRRALAGGGDCRLLDSVDFAALAPNDRRWLEVRRADCTRTEQPQQTTDRLTAVVADDAGDEPAREAALRLAALGPGRFTLDLALAVGRVFYRHDQPDLTIALLGPLVSRLPERLREQRQFEAVELVALAQIARDQPAMGAGSFGRLAARVQRPELRARALYHEGWARELAGDRAAALTRYVRAANQQPTNDLTGPTLLAACRLQWLTGRRAAAVGTLRLLRSRPEWSDAAGRAALFLAASQLARNELGTAPEMLATAAATLGTTAEVAYWSGRADELGVRPQAAVPHYLRLLRAAPHHPLAEDARRRLERPPLLAAASALSDVKRRSQHGDDRLDAWLLLPTDDPRRESLRLFLYQLYARDRELAPWLRLAAVEPEAWPLWQMAVPTAEERLLALGDWRDVGLDTVLRHFPLREPSLAFTAAQRLADAGDLPRALLLGSELMRRLGGRIPVALLPLPLRQLLLPRPWQHYVHAAASRQGVDPALLWALMREGSGFDPEALPPGGGRGVMLLDPRHADRHAAAAGLGRVRPEDLFEPRFAIPLAAARLGELARTFPGRPSLALAAYLTTPAQATAWGRWCETDDPAELLVKIGSDDVRAALTRVLTAQAAYRELYPPR